MSLLRAVSPLFSTRERRRVLVGVTTGYMLIQLSSMPVALSLPTLARSFGVGIDEAAWIIIIYLLSLGSLVLLGARLGDRYGHSRVFFVGVIVSTLAAIAIALSQSLWQIVAWRAVTGLGAALVMGNANAILAATFPAGERGRAFAVPIMGARFGTLTGLGLFGLFLQFFSWRLVFLSFLPMGLIAIAASIPMLRLREERRQSPVGPIDLLGGLLLVATASVLILSGSHLHGGEESFTSSEGILYHVPMQMLFVASLAVFILVERRVKNPVVDLRHFRQRHFSLALVSNITYHFSMLATMTLIPVLVEQGFGKAPLFVTIVLVPHMSVGLLVPLFAGWVYDKYRPKLLRPGAMAIIAAGFLGLGLFAGQVPFWAIPLMMLPISIGTAVFNPVNNATVMSSLPLEHRGFASGMLETTREIGHALGATVSATVLAMVLPGAIVTLSAREAQRFYIDGFQFSSLMVVFVLLAGAAVAYFHKAPLRPGAPGPSPAEAPSRLAAE